MGGLPVKKLFYSIIGGADGPTVIFLAGKVGNGWNWMNLFGLMIVVVMLLPNILYAIKFRNAKNRCNNKAMNILEQVGRYGSMLFMVVNVFGEYGFSSVGTFLVYLFGNGALLLGYWIVWVFFFFKQEPWMSLALAILPTLIFFISGLTLHYVLLILCAVLFGVAHIYVTWKNVKYEE